MEFTRVGAVGGDAEQGDALGARAAIGRADEVGRIEGETLLAGGDGTNGSAVLGGLCATVGLVVTGASAAEKFGAEGVLDNVRVAPDDEIGFAVIGNGGGAVVGMFGPAVRGVGGDVVVVAVEPKGTLEEAATGLCAYGEAGPSGPRPSGATFVAQGSRALVEAGQRLGVLGGIVDLKRTVRPVGLEVLNVEGGCENVEVGC